MNPKLLLLLTWAWGHQHATKSRSMKLDTFLSKIQELADSGMPLTRQELEKLIQIYPALSEYYELGADEITIKPEQAEMPLEPPPTEAEPPQDTDTTTDLADLPDLDTEPEPTPAQPASPVSQPTQPPTPGPRDIVAGMAARSRKRNQPR